MRRSPWLLVLLAAALALVTWFALRGSNRAADVARSGAITGGGPEAQRDTALDAPEEASEVRRESPSEVAVAPLAPSPPSTAALRGSLAIDFAGREPRDRLLLSILDGGRNVLESLDVDADRVVLTELPAGPVQVELSHSLGKVLASAKAQVQAHQLAVVTLDWPPPLNDRRHRTIRGDLLVSFEHLDQLPARGLQLELAPLLDSEAQKREALQSRQLRVDQLAYGTGEARRFAFEGLPEGGYELRLVPLFASLPVNLTEKDAEIEVRLECGPIGRALLHFEGPDATIVRPRSVRARPVGGDGLAPAVRVPWNAKYEAFDFAAQAGDYAFELDLEGRRSATLHWTLEPGRSEHRLEVPSHGPVEVLLLGDAQGLRVGDFSAKPEGDGRVLSLRLVRRSEPAEAARLVLSVDRVGPYRLDFEREGRKRQFLVVIASPAANDANSALEWQLE